MANYKDKINIAKEKGIIIHGNILEKNIVGVYKFFRTKENEEAYCFYIGKSTNIVDRLLGSRDGHIYMYLNNNFSKVVPKKIDEYLTKGYKIEIEIIEIDYHDEKFTNSAHRLALAELNEIVKYQNKGECEFQLPENVGINEEKFWNNKYNILK